MKQKRKLDYVFIGAITWVILEFLAVAWIISSGFHDEETKCFDKYGSEIINQTCTHEVPNINQTIYNIWSSTFLLMVFPLMFIGINIAMKEKLSIFE